MEAHHSVKKMVLTQEEIPEEGGQKKAVKKEIPKSHLYYCRIFQLFSLFTFFVVDVLV